MSGTTMDAAAFNAFEAAGWQTAADAYHRFFGPITGHVIDALLDGARVGPGSRVLDVATGPGYVAARALARGARVVAVDVAPAMLDLARALHAGIELHPGDAEQLPFEDATFDAAVGNFVLLHLGRPELAAAEIARVLAPGGAAALTVWDVPERARLIGVFLDAMKRAGAAPPPDLPSGPPFFRFSDDQELTRLLCDAGLADAAVRTVSFTHHLASASELWDGLLHGTVRTRALLYSQSEDTKRRVREAFDEIAAVHAAPDGGLDIPVSVKLGSARKPA